jgi:hypothetical protein
MPGKADLTDLDMRARAVPYAEFARLRQEAAARIRSNVTNGLRPLPVRVHS